MNGSTGINDPVRCPHCGNFHQTKCPMVKAYEYHQDGTIKRVEFYAPADYPQLKVDWTNPRFTAAQTT